MRSGGERGPRVDAVPGRWMKPSSGLGRGFTHGPVDHLQNRPWLGDGGGISREGQQMEDNGRVTCPERPGRLPNRVITQSPAVGRELRPVESGPGALCMGSAW